MLKIKVMVSIAFCISSLNACHYKWTQPEILTHCGKVEDDLIQKLEMLDYKAQLEYDQSMKKSILGQILELKLQINALRTIKKNYVDGETQLAWAQFIDYMDSKNESQNITIIKNYPKENSIKSLGTSMVARFLRGLTIFLVMQCLLKNCMVMARSASDIQKNSELMGSLIENCAYFPRLTQICDKQLQCPDPSQFSSRLLSWIDNSGVLFKREFDCYCQKKDASTYECINNVRFALGDEGNQKNDNECITQCSYQIEGRARPLKFELSQRILNENLLIQSLFSNKEKYTMSWDEQDIVWALLRLYRNLYEDNQLNPKDWRYELVKLNPEASALKDTYGYYERAVIAENTQRIALEKLAEYYKYAVKEGKVPQALVKFHKCLVSIAQAKNQKHTIEQTLHLVYEFAKDHLNYINNAFNILKALDNEGTCTENSCDKEFLIF